MTTVDLPDLPELPWDASEGPVFQAPWQAAAFAMTVRLHEHGHFTWPEWTDQLSSEIARAKQRGEADLGDSYYEHWLSALEKMVVAKGLGSMELLGKLKQDWTEATLATPHGQPIELGRHRPADEKRLEA